MQNGISIGRRGWSGRTASLPLSRFLVVHSFFFFSYLVTHTGRTSGLISTTYAPYDVFLNNDVSFGSSGKITQAKVVDPCFPEKQQHDWRYVHRVRKKEATLFSTIQLSHSLVDFYNFYTVGNRNEHSTTTGNLLT